MIKIPACVILLLFLSTSQVQSIQLEPREKDIKEAIEYGKLRKDLPHPELLKDWRVDLGYGVGAATIVTPFGQIVIMSKEAAAGFRELTDYEIKKAIEDKKGKLSFGCTLYGERIDFPKDCKAVLEYKGKVFEPSDKSFPASANYTKSYPKPPRYWALCFLSFKVGEIDPQAKVLLVVSGADGKELKFPFELPNIR